MYKSNLLFRYVYRKYENDFVYDSYGKYFVVLGNCVFKESSIIDSISYKNNFTKKLIKRILEK